MLYSLVRTAALLLTCSTADSITRALKHNFTDPCLFYDDMWYAFSTTWNGLHTPQATSLGFETWTLNTGVDTMPDLPKRVCAPNSSVASPYMDQLGEDSYIIYFDATPNDNTYRRCVGAATSTSVEGPYNLSEDTIACGDNKYGFIDPSGFLDASTSLRYVLYKLDGTNPGPPSAPLPEVPAQTFIQQVATTDGVSLIGSPVSILESVGGTADYGTVEAPSLAVNPSGSGYILFYSSGFYQNDTYTVSYATADEITGPYSGRTVLLATGDDGLTAPGGADVARDGKHMVFHADAESTWNNVRYMYTAEVGVSGTTVEVM